MPIGTRCYEEVAMRIDLNFLPFEISSLYQCFVKNMKMKSVRMVIFYKQFRKVFL